MRLWYHEDSDTLFWEEMGEAAMVCDDVTDIGRMRQVARDRGVEEPVDAPGYDITRDPEKPAHPLAKQPAFVGTMGGRPVEVTSEGKLLVGPKFTIADAIIASHKKWERKPADLYPTPVNATESIIELIKTLGVKRAWEPACGDGRIARVLEWHDIEVIATDLREHCGFGWGGLDFLTEDPMEKWGWEIGEIDMIMTNPPFSLARQFIERALTLAPVVIMLVKQNYYNTDNRYDFFEDMRPNFFLPLTWRLAFLPERGKSPLMDCAWAVWIRDANDLFDGEGRPIDGCIMQPVRRKVYPGYHGAGIKSATAALTEAIDELAGTISGLL